jgi:hypothetical protein
MWTCSRPKRTSSTTERGQALPLRPCPSYSGGACPRSRYHRACPSTVPPFTVGPVPVRPRASPRGTPPRKKAPTRGRAGPVPGGDFGTRESRDCPRQEPPTRNPPPGTVPAESGHVMRVSIVQECLHIRPDRVTARLQCYACHASRDRSLLPAPRASMSRREEWEGSRSSATTTTGMTSSTYWSTPPRGTPGLSTRIASWTRISTLSSRRRRMPSPEECTGCYSAMRSASTPAAGVSVISSRAASGRGGSTTTSTSQRLTSTC